MTDIFTITYTARSTTYTLNGVDATTGLTIQYLGDQGFGLAPIRRITTRGPLQDGDSDIDFRLDPRVLQLPLMVVNTSSTPRYQHYEIREKLLQVFRPGDDAYIAIFRNNGLSSPTRQINVRVLGGLSFDVDPNSWNVRTVVQLRASDPTWYSGSTISTRYSNTYLNANINGSQDFVNQGNWITYPIIRLNGPITNPVITNSTTGQSITFTGTISAGAYYDIDLEYGKKTVIDNLGVNRISTVNPSSNLATWALQPGNSTIAITGTGTTAATNAVFSFFYRFTGI
jgi:hypothetical protein